MLQYKSVNFSDIMSYEWKDKVVLITGAAGGIGAAVVNILLESEQVKHVTILDIADEGFTLETNLITKYGNKVKFIKCDVTNEDQLFGGFKSVIDQCGYIDVVINNAAIMNDGYKLYKKMVDVNVTALFVSTLKALELMRKDKGGRGGTIINISSMAALIQSPFLPMYNATKSAVLQFTLCLSMDDYYLRTGVRLFSVCFGATGTELLSAKKVENFDEYIQSALRKAVQERPLQKPESAARGVVEVFKKSKNGATWLIALDKPAQDISDNVTKGYEIMSQGISYARNVSLESNDS